jgi:hypothetical protein
LAKNSAPLPVATAIPLVWFHVEHATPRLIVDFLRWQEAAKIWPPNIPRAGSTGGGHLSLGFRAGDDAAAVRAWFVARGVDIK